MGMYLGLIAFVIALSVLVKAGDGNPKRQDSVILFWALLAIFLLLALKGDTVGNDTAGYHTQYLLSAETSWGDFDYVYFEKGYILLMKLFSKTGLPFQGFTAAIYGLLCTAYYFFLRRYSENVTLSLLILIGYQFLVFHISGLRQTLAMAVCLLAFLALDQGRPLLSLGLTALASTFHQSALIFFAVYPIAALRGRRIPAAVMALAGGMLVLLRPVLWRLALLIFRDIDPATGMDIGGNCLFLAGMALFLNYTAAAFPGSEARGTIRCRERFFGQMAAAALVGDLVLSGSPLLRCNLYFTLFLIPGIPNALRRYEPRTRLMGSIAMGGFLILLFYFQTLSVNQLGLIPYRFFWE